MQGAGPDQFREYFKPAKTRIHRGREADRRHDRQLETHRKGKYLEILGNSILGLVDVYNLLPADIVKGDSVPKFQTGLQDYLKQAAMKGTDGWQKTFSPRLAIYAHPLRNARVVNMDATEQQVHFRVVTLRPMI